MKTKTEQMLHDMSAALGRTVPLDELAEILLQKVNILTLDLLVEKQKCSNLEKANSDLWEKIRNASSLL